MSDTPSQIPCRDTCHEASASSSTPSTTPTVLSSHIDQAEGANIQEKSQHRRLRESGRLLLRAQLKDEGQDRTSVTKAVNLYDHETATLAINDLFSYIRHRLKNQFLEQWLRQARQTLLCQLPPGSDATNKRQCTAVSTRLCTCTSSRVRRQRAKVQATASFSSLKHSAFLDVQPAGSQVHYSRFLLRFTTTSQYNYSTKFTHMQTQHFTSFVSTCARKPCAT